MAGNDDFDPRPHARLRLRFHIAEKGLQVGALLGPVAATVVHLIKQRTLVGLDLAHLGRSAAIGSGLMCGVSIMAGEVQYATAEHYLTPKMRISGLDDDGIEDRVYRLHFNRGQNRVDKFAAAGAVGGLVAYGAMKRDGKSAVGMMALGYGLGVIAHVVSDRLANKDVN
jgi:hypothetical protein